MTPLVVGLTGGIGVGKSTVAARFARRGAAVVDVDELGRAVLEPTGDAYDEVVEAFGAGVLAPDGTIDRAALAAEVFGAGNRLAELEAISHPAINRRLGEIVASSPSPIMVLDMAVLTESTLGRTADGPMFHRVVVVEAPAEARIDRLRQRGMTEDQARDRMAAQASDDDRRLLADLVVPNGDGLDALDEIVGILWPTIEAWAAQARHTDDSAGRGS